MAIYSPIVVVFALGNKTKDALLLSGAAGHLQWDGGFYEYYQIGKVDEDHSAEDGSESPGELKATGLNSPWGIEWMIYEKTGWTRHYVMWKVSWINIQMMLADAPRMGKKGKDSKQFVKSDKELIEFLNIN